MIPIVILAIALSACSTMKNKDPPDQIPDVVAVDYVGWLQEARAEIQRKADQLAYEKAQKDHADMVRRWEQLKQKKLEPTPQADILRYYRGRGGGRRGCGSRGGPGYRLGNGKCAGWR